MSQRHPIRSECYLLTILSVAHVRLLPTHYIHTRILHILFEDESGSRIANLTGVQEVKRDGSRVNLTIRYSLVCDPSISLSENSSFTHECSFLSVPMF